jgi:threonine dehydratase
MRALMEAHHMMIEGAAAVALAAFEKQKAQWREANVVIILCGANISLSTLKTVLS